MAHFAKLDKNNIVTFVTVGSNADRGDEQALSERTGDTYKQTSYNTKGGVHYGQNGQPDGGVPLRANYAGIGYIYDPINDVFYAPQPYPSWTISAPAWIWQAPTPMPTDGQAYIWDESTLSWVTT